MQRFLHTLQKGQKPSTYLVDGREWEAFDWSEWHRLYLDIDGVKLTVSCLGEGSFSWEYWRLLGEGPGGTVSFTKRDSAESVEAACAAALAYSPELAEVDYLGSSYVCYGARRRDSDTIDWTFIVDGEGAEVWGPFPNGDKPAYFRWRRTWAPAARMLERFCGQSQMDGTVLTLHDAMIAALDAPEAFKRACAALVATVTRGEQQ